MKAGWGCAAPLCLFIKVKLSVCKLWKRMGSVSLGTRRKWMISFTSRPLYPRERTPVPIKQEAGWAPKLVWTFRPNKKFLALVVIRNPNRISSSVFAIMSTLSHVLFIIHSTEAGRRKLLLHLINRLGLLVLGLHIVGLISFSQENFGTVPVPLKSFHHSLLWSHLYSLSYQLCR